MTFVLERIESLFPKELSDQRKGRLRDGLKQFLDKGTRDRTYTDFYSTKIYPYFLQGDLINELRFPEWSLESREFTKSYYDAVVLSNTCDIDEANDRKIPKKVLLAKLLPLIDFEEGLTVNNIPSRKEILKNLRNQEYSNLMYFPAINNKEYIAYLDEISWITLEELNELKERISQNRIASLDYFGYYLFMFKVAYHLCRLPEETDR